MTCCCSNEIVSVLPHSPTLYFYYFEFVGVDSAIKRCIELGVGKR